MVRSECVYTFAIEKKNSCFVSEFYSPMFSIHRMPVLSETNSLRGIPHEVWAMYLVHRQVLLVRKVLGELILNFNLFLYTYYEEIYC